MRPLVQQTGKNCRCQSSGGSLRSAGGGLRIWPRGRARRRLNASLLALIIIFAAVTSKVIIWPATGMPPRVDAIVVLAGPGNRLAVALQLTRENRANFLVYSQGQHGYSGPCPASVPEVKLICFDPDPGNTRGEAEFAARLARKYDWRSVVLITTREQDTRARLLMERCYSGPVYVVTVARAWYDWPYQIVYGWGALFKALVLVRAC
jgi:uncharacterized SAM-binding protein YcdF (DUF218 family)